LDFDQFGQVHDRRRFLLRSTWGLGAAALSHLFSVEGRTVAQALPEASPLAPKQPHFPATAKNVIFLFMSGGPSQLDLFDPKPELRKWHGKALPASKTKDLKLAFVKPTSAVMASPREFKQFGESGIPFSDFLPHIATCANDICMVHSMHTDAFNHDPGELLLMTGSTLLGRPSIGSWVVYGLGSESQDLPGFIVLGSGKGPSSGSNVWSSGFLPSSLQGTRFRSNGDPVLYLSTPDGMNQELQRARLDAIRWLNDKRRHVTGDQEIESRIASYELAFRVQSAAPDLLDFSDESPQTLKAYGVHQEPTHPYAVNCLLARRMVERGVRFVMLTHGDWDDHVKLDEHLAENCQITDQPAAALLKDLKQRGLLDSTLVIWGGEFGRTPIGQINRLDEAAGRDHHPNAFSLWLAGGGIQGGQAVGRTDELGLEIVEDSIHVHDLQATILHCLGFDHERLTYEHAGRRFRLTDVEGNVVKKLLRS
jgi:hypothetical protein